MYIPRLEWRVSPQKASYTTPSLTTITNKKKPPLNKNETTTNTLQILHTLFSLLTLFIQISIDLLFTYYSNPPATQ